MVWSPRETAAADHECDVLSTVLALIGNQCGVSRGPTFVTHSSFPGRADSPAIAAAPCAGRIAAPPDWAGATALWVYSVVVSRRAGA